MSWCFSIICWKTLIPPMNLPCIYVKNLVCLYAWAYFWNLYSVPLIYLSNLMLILRFLNYCNFLISLNQIMCFPTLFLFFKVVLAILGPLHFHTHFKIILPISKSLLGFRIFNYQSGIKIFHCSCGSVWFSLQFYRSCFSCFEALLLGALNILVILPVTVCYHHEATIPGNILCSEI